MKLQHLAIIFVIIILPISLVVGEYIQMQIDTIALQTTYSSKLQTATYDSMKAFRLNTVNNKYSSVSDSKVRDIDAAINTYFSSLGEEILVLGQAREQIEEFTPALLYTLYDGYYIYSKYYNEKDEEYQYGLKPYIYYTCRYINEVKDIDITVNYTLDNYITIYGMIDQNYITKSGNIINPDMVTDIQWENGKLKSLKYGNIEIEEEVLTEQIIYLDSNNTANKNTYNYIIYNNNKVYYEGKVGGMHRYFTINSNFKKQYIIDQAMQKELENKTKDGKLYSDSALNYYYDAYLFSKWANQYLSGINQTHAVDVNGEKITDFTSNTGETPIFSYSGNFDITDSCFDLNRISVIRRSIETNLMTAIANYNRLSQKGYEYALPVFNEEDWYKITNNISVTSFLQGIPIGMKYYNNYCVVTNNVNREVVTLDSLYVITDDGEVHLPDCKKVLDNNIQVSKVYKNTDYERQTVVIPEGNDEYYYPHFETKCYSCLVNVSSRYDIDYLSGTVKEYNKQTEEYEIKTVNINRLNKLRKEVLQAFGRECYDLYKVNEYFKGYDETISTDSITKEETANIETEVIWNSVSHRATLKIKKKAGVSETLKIQYLVNPTNEQMSTDSEWIDYDTNKAPITNCLWTGWQRGADQVYVRLYDETYDGDYMVVNIKDPIDPEVASIRVVEGEPNGKNGYYTYNKINVEITQGKDNQSGLSQLSYSMGSMSNKSDININETIRNSNENEIIKITEEIYNEGEFEVIAKTFDYASYPYGRSSVTTPFQIKKDSIKPTKPTIHVGEADGENGYYKNEVEAKFTYGTDPGTYPSGIDTLYYYISKIVGQEEQIVESGTLEDNGKITIDNDLEGVIKITAYMEDKAGNKSEETKVIINRDKTGPKIDELFVQNATTNSFDIVLNAIDVVSGIDRIEWNYKRWKEGNDKYKRITTYCNGIEEVNKTQKIENLVSSRYNIYVTVYDKAGNSTTKQFNGAFTKPNGASADPVGWTNKPVTITLPTEAGYITEYQIGSVTEEGWVTYDSNNRPTVSTNTTIYYKYKYNTNESIIESIIGSITISNIDKTKPTISTALSSSNVTTNGFTLSIGVTDAQSGFCKIIWYYKLSSATNYKSIEDSEDTAMHGINSGTKTQVTKTKTLTGLKSGRYNVYAVAYDVAGNISEKSKINVTLISVPKASGASINPSGWTNGNVTVTLPTKSGYTTQYQYNSTDSNNWLPYSSALSIEGNTTINYRYTDGTNAGAHNSIVVDKIDKTAPTISTVLSSSNITNTGFTLSVEVEDTLSGLGKIVWYYKLSSASEYTSATDTYTTMNGSTAGTTTEVTKTKTLTDLTTGTYDAYAVVYDVAGNMVETDHITITMNTEKYIIQNGNVVNAPGAVAWAGGHSNSSGSVQYNTVYYYGGKGHTNSIKNQSWGADTGNINVSGYNNIEINPYLYIWGSTKIPWPEMQIYGDEELIATYNGTNLYSSSTENYNTVIKDAKKIIIDISNYDTIRVYINASVGTDEEKWAEVHVGFKNIRLYN